MSKGERAVRDAVRSVPFPGKSRASLFHEAGAVGRLLGSVGLGHRRGHSRHLGFGIGEIATMATTVVRITLNEAARRTLRAATRCPMASGHCWECSLRRNLGLQPSNCGHACSAVYQPPSTRPATRTANRFLSTSDPSYGSPSDSPIARTATGRETPQASLGRAGWPWADVRPDATS
jgi:hypothetical protein